MGWPIISALLPCRYQEELARNNALDFDDLLSLSVALLREVPEVLRKYRNRYRYCAVLRDMGRGSLAGRRDGGDGSQDRCSSCVLMN